MPQVIAQVRDDAWPEIGSADELHDALVRARLPDAKTKRTCPEFVEALRAAASRHAR